MFLKASQILNKPVFAQKEEEQTGRVLEVIIDPQNGRLLGFLVVQPFLKPRLVSEMDVSQILSEGLLINSVDSLIEPTEIVKVGEIIKEKIKILGAKAETESGKRLGRIEDFVFETQTRLMVKIYIRGGLFLPSLILPAEGIVKIEKGRVVFADQILEHSKTAEAITT